jgi:predicted nucleic acid-binding protein
MSVKACVVDASVGLAWVHPGQATKETNLLLESLKQGTSLIVPSLWFLEMANALLVLERRGRLGAQEREEALLALGSLPLQVEAETHLKAFGEISRIATAHNLSVYDAAYLELAVSERLPIATKDEALKAAARKCGVKLFLEG